MAKGDDNYRTKYSHYSPYLLTGDRRQNQAVKKEQKDNFNRLNRGLIRRTRRIVCSC